MPTGRNGHAGRLSRDDEMGDLMMKTPTLAQFKAWTRQNHEIARAVCVAQACAETKRKQVDAYIAPVFEQFTFYPSADMLAHGMANERITDIKSLYLTDLESVPYKTFCKMCDEAHRAHGFDGEAGYCPALIAEDLYIKAQNVLLKSGCELLGLADIPYSPDLRKQMLDLLLGACFAKDNQVAA